jgi:hypothetical protein
MGRLQICVILKYKNRLTSAEHVEHCGHPSVSRRVGHIVGICCLIHQDSHVTIHNLAEELKLFRRTL